MKTIIISGTYTIIDGGTSYDISLFGQAPASPLAILITTFRLDCMNYGELETFCRQKYIEYYNETLSDIISMSNLNELKKQRQDPSHKRRFLVIDSPFNQHWYPDMIGKAFDTPPVYCQVRDIKLNISINQICHEVESK